MNLEKKRGDQNQICQVIFDEKEIDDDIEILNKIKSFLTLFKSQPSKNVNAIEKFLCPIATPSPSPSNKYLWKRNV